MKKNPEDTCLIAGFGNPGAKYKNTRHNLGFQAVDLLCKEWDLQLSDQRFQAFSNSIIYRDKKIVVACPQTYMNHSGLTVKYLMEYYKLEIRNLMVIHDDLDLDVGRIKVVRRGGAGGHHGVESVIHHLGAMGFNRIKIGVGRPRYNEPIEDFVLNPPYDDQQEATTVALHKAVEAITLFVLNGVESAMTNLNSAKMMR